MRTLTVLPILPILLQLANTGHAQAQPARARVHACLRAPLVFEDWRGREAGADFVARGAGYALFVGAEGAAMRLRGEGGANVAVRARLVGASLDQRVEARKPEAPVHHLLGSDPSHWRTNVKTHGEVRFAGAWPGIDVLYHGSQGELEYDFVVAPGADPDRIRLRFEGGAEPSIDEQGDLVVAVGSGAIRHRRPIAYQERDGARLPVGAQYRVAGREVRFTLGAFDPARELVIDPIIAWSSYLGGSSADQDSRIAVDAQGFAYVSAWTFSANFPTRGPIQPYGGGSDACVTKIAPDGRSIVWSTFLGGRSGDTPNDLAVAQDGSVAVTGVTQSPDFPLRNPYQTMNLGSAATFLSVLDPTGASLVYSTYYTGSGSVQARGVCFDGPGSIVIAGKSDSANMPTTAGAFQRMYRGMVDAFVAKFDPRGGPASLQFATFLGGTGPDEGWSVAVDSARRVCVYGRTQSNDLPVVSSLQPLRGPDDAFVSVLDASLGALLYSTYLGGSGRELFANVHLPGAITVDGQDALYVTGDTTSADFPTTPGAHDRTFGGFRDAFVTKLSPFRPQGPLVWSTYLGGALSEDGGQDVAVDLDGNVAVSGFTASMDFPRVHPTHPAAIVGGARPFVALLNPSGSALRFATTVGNASTSTQASGVGFDRAGNVYVTGTSTMFPTTPGTFQPQSGGGADLFVLRIELPRASALNYGAGLAGTLGVPSLQASAPPVLGTRITLNLGNSLGAATPGLLVVGTQRAAVPILGGTLLLVPVINVPLNVPAAGLMLPLDVRDDNSLSGALFQAQGFLFDPGAVQSLAMTRGLELRVGI